MEEIKGYDDWLITQPPEILLGHCEECGDEIYLSQDYYKANVGKIHKDCFEVFSLGYFNAELYDGSESTDSLKGGDWYG